MTVGDPIPRMREMTNRDYFDIPRASARYRIETSIGETEKEGVVRRAQEIHGVSYVNYGYFDASGLVDKDIDPRLIPELDGTRSSDGRVVANYLLARPLEGGIDNAVASVRVLDIDKSGNLEDLPTYKYFAERIDPAVRSRLDNIMDLYGKESVREIAALATIDTDDTHRSSFELIRALIQNSVIKQEAHGHRELYLASLTPNSFGPVMNYIGQKSAEVLGEQVSIFSKDPRARSIKVVPVLIDLTKVIDNTVDAIERTTDGSNTVELVKNLSDFVDGLDPALVSRRVSAILKRFSS
jgi:hypothetical protein